MSYIPPLGTTRPSPEIDMKSTGATLLFTTPTGKGDFIITDIVAIPDDITGAGTAPIFDIGTNAPDYDNILSPFTPAAVDNTKSENILATGEVLVIPEATDVYLHVNTAATGYTTYVMEVYIRGFYHSS